MIDVSVDENVETANPNVLAKAWAPDAECDRHPDCFSAIEDQLSDPNVVLIVGTTIVRAWCGTGTYVLTRCGK